MNSLRTSIKSFQNFLFKLRFMAWWQMWDSWLLRTVKSPVGVGWEVGTRGVAPPSCNLSTRCVRVLASCDRYGSRLKVSIDFSVKRTRSSTEFYVRTITFSENCTWNMLKINCLPWWVWTFQEVLYQVLEIGVLIGLRDLCKSHGHDLCKSHEHTWWNV